MVNYLIHQHLEVISNYLSVSIITHHCQKQKVHEIPDKTNSTIYVNAVTSVLASALENSMISQSFQNTHQRPSSYVRYLEDKISLRTLFNFYASISLLHDKQIQPGFHCPTSVHLFHQTKCYVRVSWTMSTCPHNSYLLTQPR